MKKIFFSLAGLILLLACNRQPEDNKLTTISGSVEPVLSGNVIVNIGALIDSAKIDKEGNFSLSVPVEAPGTGLIIFNNSFSSIYLEAGKSLFIKILADDFPDKTEFSDELGPVNHYLLLATKLERQTTIDNEKLFTKNPQEFIAFTDSIEDLKLTLLKEYVKRYPEIDSVFVTRHKTDIHYSWANQRLIYPGYHALFSGEVAKLPDDYHPTYLNEIELNNPELMVSNVFQSFIDDYLDFKQALYIDDNPKTSKLWFPESVARFRVIQQVFTDTLIRDYALFTSMSDHLDNFGTEHLETFITNFEIHCSNEDFISIIKLKLENLKKLARGEMAPVFTAFNVEVNQVSLSDYAGSLVYVNLWASWSAWSINEFPYWEKLIRQFESRGVKFISVSMDFTKDTNKWKYILENQKLGGIQLIQDSETDIWHDQYYIGDLPRYLLIDADGKIISVHAPRPSENMENTLEQLLNENF
ncbi:MAG: TlpA family protein disulfide reductase [Bacteroidetes bacterium]|nr:TlpA family protein disulfide reductase [Bacteroidota bacterium]